MTPQPRRIDTRNIDQWVDAIWETYCPLDVVPERDGSFSSSMTRRDFDQLKTVEVRATPQEFHRTEQMIKRHPADDLNLCMVTDGEALLVQDGRGCVLSRGEYTIVESTRPYTVVVREPSRLLDFAWPRDAIGLSETESREVTARAFGSESPMGRWLSPMLAGLCDMDSGLSDAGAIRLANGLGGLLVTAALELSRPVEVDGRSRQQYESMITFIERNLENPDLTADSVADAFFVSTRTVHRLFSRFDKSVAAVIRDMRLDACRQMMVSSAHRHQSIGFIASQFGFSSLSVFSRAFAAKYGTAPNHYRRTRS